MKGAVSHQTPLRLLAEVAKCEIKKADAIRRTCPCIKFFAMQKQIPIIDFLQGAAHLLKCILKVDTKGRIPVSGSVELA